MFKAIRIQVLLVSLGLLLAMSVTAGGCNTVSGGDTNTTTTTSQVYDVTVQKAYDLVQENEGNTDFVVLDVRTPDEYAEGYIEGAINIDYYADDFENSLDKLDKDKTYLVYCRSGRRSAEARDVMTELGFQNIYNMTGGFQDWQSEDYPIVH